MLKKIALGLIVILAALIGYASIQPPDYVVSREITINAPAEKIFPYLNQAQLADQWGPWREIDPEAKMTFSGPEAGVGSRTSWTDGKQLGTGSATITESVPNQRVITRLEYVKPMTMTQNAEYSIRASGHQSVVTWKVTGQRGVMERVVGLFFNMDKMVGSFFEKGLSNLKGLVEKSN